MKCNEVKGKLPEYLAGVLDDNAAQEIMLHLEGCESCRNEAEELNRNLPAGGNLKQADINKVLKKTNRKFKIGIVKVIAITVFIAWAIYMIPSILLGNFPFGQLNVSRALMDVVQFSQTDKVNSWGNSSFAFDGLTISVPLWVTVRPVTGKSFGVQKEFPAKMSLITGKITAPDFLGSEFLHPDIFKGIVLRKVQNPEIQEKILQKNAETTVATVDYSLNRLLSLQDMANLINTYDIEICWMAVEAGVEKITPQNMTFENQQVLQWGIPGKLSKPYDFDYAVLGTNNSGEFEKAVMEEMKWLDDHKSIIKPSSDLIKYNAIDNSIGNKADYLLKNGIKIYGLRATGPSSELIRLTKELDPRTMTVVDMDFWNW